MNARLRVRLLQPAAKPSPRVATSTYSPAAHWQNTAWGIQAVGVLWWFAGCKKYADGAE